MTLWRRYIEWRQRNVSTLETGHESFRVRQAGSVRDVSWDSISAVSAFKRDLLTVDCLCLLVEGSEGAMEVDEQMQGFEDWLRTLENRLHIDGQWRLHVLFPAFEPRFTEIYRRDPSSFRSGQASPC